MSIDTNPCADITLDTCELSAVENQLVLLADAIFGYEDDRRVNADRAVMRAHYVKVVMELQHLAQTLRAMGLVR